MTGNSLYSPLAQSLGLLAWLAIVTLAATLGTLASLNAPDFYTALILPSFAPPPWLFGPVWSVLYLMIAVSVWLVWRNVGIRQAAPQMTLFLLQLVANALWTWLFFGWQLGLLASLEIILLWLMILLLIRGFWQLGSRVAAALLVPYLLWVSFASLLSWSIWILNRGTL